MGTRGRGQILSIAQREEAKKIKTKLPWTKKGLSREERVVAFLEFLPITKGPLTGKKMKLLPDQLKFVREIYGNLRRDGTRVRSIGIKSEPKGNGKTGLVAGLCLCHLVGPEAEPRGEIYSAAIDRQQAGLIFAEMEAILREIPQLALLVNIIRFSKKIEVIDGPYRGSIYEALSADARRAHGISPTLFAYDELAQASDRILLDNLVNGLGKRREALGIIISTQAPSDDHPLSQLIDDGLTEEDPSTYVQLSAAPPDADPYAEATWRACNPALGVFLSLEEMQNAAKRAKRLPSFEASFRNLRLNQRVDARQDERIVTADVWKLGEGAVDRRALRGRTCWGALDLSGKHDLTSLTLVFPEEGKKDPKFSVLPLFWTPSGQMAGRSLQERQRFHDWIRKRAMIEVPGPTIKFGYVAQELVKLATEFRIAAVAYDRWRIDDFKQDLLEVDQDFAVPLVPFGQGYKEMGPAVEWLQELALTGRLVHGGHPVLTAALAGAVVVSSPAGDLKIDKERSAGRGPVRVDGAVTLAMALDLWRRVDFESSSALDDFLSNAVVA